MENKWLKALVNTGIGLVVAFGIMCMCGIFSAQDARDAMRIACDGCFTAGALMLMLGGLRWCVNGGAVDGLGYSAKILINRIRYHYEDEHRQSYAEYIQKRREKAQSPFALVISGLAVLLIAVLLFVIYKNMA